jgi:hypothetical protein
MVIVCVLLVIWSLLVGMFLYYKKRAFDCQTNPAIKCANDWKCWNETQPSPSILTPGSDSTPPSVQPNAQGADETSTPVANGIPGQVILNPGMLKFYGLPPSTSDPSVVKGRRVNSAVIKATCVPPATDITGAASWKRDGTLGCCYNGVCDKIITGGDCTAPPFC